jgi:phenylpropionate dioxygenase-like ring-hydroxylating dioxygenase large terminal subunit
MRPLLEACNLPAECYNSEKWFEREMERVFMPSWFLVGREDELLEPGSYMAIDTEWSGPVAVCRGTDGLLHAFANVCCHRGAKVMPEGRGQASKLGLICPYHAWTYEYDGRLKWAPGMQRTLNFDESDIRLAPVRLSTFHGFIFINHSSTAKSLEEALGDIPEKLPQWFGPEGKVKDTVCVGRREYEVPCNWKFLMENTCETYHTSVVHKGSLGPMKSFPMEPHVGDWDGVRVPTQRTVVPLPGDFEGDPHPLPAFTDQTAFVNLFPSLQINVTWDCLWWMNLIPTGAQSTRIQMGFLFPRETRQLEDFPTKLERYLHRWNVAVTEDNSISLNQQRGVRSAFRVPGRFGELEFGTHNFNNWLLARMLDGHDQKWDPGNRVFIAKQDDLWSNADDRVTALAAASEEVENNANAGSRI